jgi:hypothetical protein
MVYGSYKDEDHNLIAAIESALINANNLITDAMDWAGELTERNPDKEVQAQALFDELYSLHMDVESTDFGEDLHEMFQSERGEDYWEHKND